VRIAEHRERVEGLPDLLLYASMVDDGILLLQDGALLCAWSYRGPDLETATHEEMASISARLNGILKLGSGWMIHCDAIRSFAPDYPDEGFFPDPVTRLIDMERRQQFSMEGTHFESEYFLALTYLPPMQKEEALKGFLFEGSEKITTDVATRVLDYYKRKVSQFDDIFRSMFHAHRLGRVQLTDELGYKHDFDNLLRYVRRCVAGQDYKFSLPQIPVYLHDLIGTEDFTGGISPKMGKRHIRVVAIDGFPQNSVPGILAALDTLPFEYRWNTRAQMIDAEVARTVLEKKHRRWRGKVRGFMDQLWNRPNGTINHYAQEMANDAEAAMSVASAGDVQFALYSSNVILMDENEERIGDNVAAVVTVVKNSGFAPRVETINAIEAWRGSLPGDGYRNLRRVYVHTINLSDSLPISAVWTGERVNPSALMPPNSPPLALTTSIGATPYRVNLHVSDVGHTLILGPTGSGKSALLGFLAAQWFRYPNAKVVVFDKGKSMFVLNQASGGDFYDLGGDQSDLAFCPLRDIDNPNDAAWAVDWIESLCAMSGLVPITPAQRNAITQGIKSLAHATTEFRSLTEFLAAVQDVEVREALEHYTLRGPLGELLDARTDSLQTSRFTVFEMENLMGAGDGNSKGLVAVLLYLFQQIEKRLDGTPTLVILDEAWVYLKHDLFRNKVKDWLKTMRRKNACVIMATQSISDVINSEIRDVVLESCPTKILLPNSEAGNANSHAFYTQLGLNEREISIIQTAIPKREYYFMSPLGRRLVALGLGGVALAFVGSSSVEDRKAAEALITRYHGDQAWVEEWVRLRARRSGNTTMIEWADALHYDEE
jgi:type IV secretion/conjugal transfer VirB4 family ATPase